MAASSFFGKIRRVFSGTSSAHPSTSASSSSSSAPSSDTAVSIKKTKKQALKALRNPASSDEDVIRSFIAMDMALNDFDSKLNARIREVASRMSIIDICRLDETLSPYMLKIHKYKLRCVMSSILGVEVTVSEFSEMDFNLRLVPRYLNHYVITDSIAKQLVVYLKKNPQYQVLDFSHLEDKALIGGLYQLNIVDEKSIILSGIKIILNAKLNGELPHIKQIYFTINQTAGYRIDKANIPGFDLETKAVIKAIDTNPDHSDSKYAMIGAFDSDRKFYTLEIS